MPSAFEIEVWIWYSLTWGIVIARMVSRAMLLRSVKKLQVDDYLMVCTMLTYTVLMICMDIIQYTSSNLIDPNDHTELIPIVVKAKEFGSKMVLVVEQMQIVTIWLLKACLLIMYNRITLSLRQNLAVKIVTGYVAGGFILMEILYFGVWCRPFSQYWAVPPDDPQCSAATNHLITNAVLNISSDLMIILIPMPILLRSQLPTKRKAMLTAVFALGSFTILSAILNKYYSFHEPFGSEWTYWYVRESSTALITTNLPYIWTLIRRIFNLTSFHNSSNKQSTHPSINFLSRARRSIIRTEETVLRQSDSQERIYATTSVPLKIYQRRDVEVTSEEAPPPGQRPPPSGITCHETSTTVIRETSQRASRDGETGSERSAAGVVKVFHGV